MARVLGYWDIRGLAQAIRFMLHYVGEEFEDRMYSLGPAPEYSRENWLKVKFTLGLQIPNLPYFIDGDVKITQSNAILRYLGRKYDLGGKTDEEKLLVDMMMEEYADFRVAFSKLCYSPNFDALWEDFAKDLPRKLKVFEEFLGDNPFFIGQKVTIVDFPLYEYLTQHGALVPGCFKDFPKLQAFLKRFENIPQIKRYIDSGRCLKGPFNSRSAAFVGYID